MTRFDFRSCSWEMGKWEYTSTVDENGSVPQVVMSSSVFRGYDSNCCAHFLTARDDENLSFRSPSSYRYLDLPYGNHELSRVTGKKQKTPNVHTSLHWISLCEGYKSTSSFINYILYVIVKQIIM